MSYYDGDLKTVLARFHKHADTDTRKDILKNLSDNQLSRVVIQGVKCEFEREGLEELALIMLDVIARDPRSRTHDVHGENEVVVKDEEANGQCEVVIKMEELDDDNQVTIMRSKHDSALAPTPGLSTIASVSTSSSANRGRESQKRPDTIQDRPTRAEETESAFRGFVPKYHAHGPRMPDYMEMRRNEYSHGPGQVNYLDRWSNRDTHGTGQAAYLQRFSDRDAAQACYPFPKRLRWRV